MSPRSRAKNRSSEGDERVGFNAAGPSSLLESHRHSREGGNPYTLTMRLYRKTVAFMDPRLRGDDIKR